MKPIIQPAGNFFSQNEHTLLREEKDQRKSIYYNLMPFIFGKKWRKVGAVVWHQGCYSWSDILVSWERRFQGIWLSRTRQRLWWHIDGVEDRVGFEDWLNIAFQRHPLFDAGHMLTLDVAGHLASWFVAVSTIYESAAPTSCEGDSRDGREGVMD